MPKATLSPEEPILTQFPNGWYMICPAGTDLPDLLRWKFPLNTLADHDYGKWPQAQDERLATVNCEIFIPDPDEWVLPNTKGKNREEILKIGSEFGKTLPEGWIWQEPSMETLILALFNYWQQTGNYPLSSNLDWVQCRNRINSYRRARWRSYFFSRFRFVVGTFCEDSIFIAHGSDKGFTVLVVCAGQYVTEGR